MSVGRTTMCFAPTFAIRQARGIDELFADSVVRRHQSLLDRSHNEFEGVWHIVSKNADRQGVADIFRLDYPREIELIAYGLIVHSNDQVADQNARVLGRRIGFDNENHRVRSLVAVSALAADR